MSLAPLFSAVDPSERKARLRSLRMASRLICGPRGRALERALHAAERDVTALPAELAQIDMLEAMDRRRVLSAWAQTLRPEPEAAR